VLELGHLEPEGVELLLPRLGLIGRRGALFAALPRHDQLLPQLAELVLLLLDHIRLALALAEGRQLAGDGLQVGLGLGPRALGVGPLLPQPLGLLPQVLSLGALLLELAHLSLELVEGLLALSDHLAALVDLLLEPRQLLLGSLARATTAAAAALAIVVVVILRLREHLTLTLLCVVSCRWSCRVRATPASKEDEMWGVRCPSSRFRTCWDRFRLQTTRRPTPAPCPNCPSCPPFNVAHGVRVSACVRVVCVSCVCRVCAV
jgi:hypothetical protein